MDHIVSTTVFLKDVIERKMNEVYATYFKNAARSGNG